MMGDNRVLIDTNVLVYSTVSSCPKFHEARTWLSQLAARGDNLFITPQIVREYLVVLPRGAVFAETFTVEQALGEIEAILKTVIELDETVEVATQLRRLIKKYDVCGKNIHDANLVATMLVYRITRLATYNPKDFVRFTEIILEPMP